MLNELSYGSKLYFRNFRTLALVGLPIYVFSNLLIEALAFNGAGFRTIVFFQIAIQVYMAGVIITALNQCALGKSVRAGDTWSAGARYCGAVLATTILANIITTAAFLVFIIPGIYCLIRFAFIELAVVLENRAGKDARERSWELAGKRSWSIMLVSVVYFPIMLGLGFLPLIVEGSATGSEEIWALVRIAYGCTLDLIDPLFTAILYSLFVHSAGYELSLPAAEPPPIVVDSASSQEFDMFANAQNPVSGADQPGIDSER